MDLPDVNPVPGCFSPLDQENLENAYKAFIAFITCPAKDYVAWKLFYKDLITNFSPRMILQNVVSILNKLSGHSQNKRRVPEFLLNVLSKNLSLKHKTLDFAINSKTAIQMPDDGQCLNHGNCSSFSANFMPLGKTACANQRKRKRE